MKSAQDFQDQTHVSRETLACYTHWHAQLCVWNKNINLVSPQSLKDFWARHAWDCYQMSLQMPAPTATKNLHDGRYRYWADLGAGAGFPGLAIAIACRNFSPVLQIDLIEANQNKARFLRMMIRELSLPAIVLPLRIEAHAHTKVLYDVISARALAPLTMLLTHASSFWHKDTQGLFLKGEEWQQEVELAQKKWTFSYEAIQSHTQQQACMLRIKNLSLR